MPNSIVTVAANTSGFAGATATISSSGSDAQGVVTFTTSATIPGSGPYLLFTLTWAGSFGKTYAILPTFIVFPCSNAFAARTAAQQAATAALGPFFCIANTLLTTLAVYCTNAPAESTAYDIGYAVIVGP
jgi:hypothetical protein